MSRTPQQNQRFDLLLKAINGDPDAIDAVFEGAGAGGFGDDAHFNAMPGEQTITSEDTWETVHTAVFELNGGTYWADVLVFFTGEEINRSYQIQYLVNGTPTGDIISKELKDVNDQIEYNTFNELVLPAGTLTLTVQARIPAGGGVPSMTVTRNRTRLWKREA